MRIKSFCHDIVYFRNAVFGILGKFLARFLAGFGEGDSEGKEREEVEEF